ncbi:MAG: hypothetical protein HDS31_05590 [Bacteroides sp.]|nr:hypothetical protein [Bacteroides sp.]
MTKTNEEQSRQLAVQRERIAELTAKLKRKSAQIAWFQRQIYGRRSERHIAIDTIDNPPRLF